MFFKIGVLKNFANFTRNFTVLELILNKVLRLNALKETPTKVFSCEMWETFKNMCFYKTLLVAASDHCEYLVKNHFDHYFTKLFI